MNTGLKNYKDEELVELYKEGNEGAFEELLKRTENLRYSLAQKYLNIPKSEIDDLLSEGMMEMVEATHKYDSKYKASFTSFLYRSISRHYDDLFRAAVSAKRNPGCFVESFDQLNSNSEYEEEGDTAGNVSLSVMCEEFNMVELRSLVDKLGLSGQERVVINLLMEGQEKPDIARRMGVQTPSVHKYVKRIGNKINLSGAYA